MLGSSTDERLGLEENNRLLPYLDSSSSDLAGKDPRYRDRITDQDIELGSISSASIGLETPNEQVDEENGIINFLSSHDSQATELKKSVASTFYGFFRWVKGPRPSRPFAIKPILPQFQNIPIVFFDRYFPGRQQRFGLLLILCLLWIALFSIVLSASISGCHISGYHTPIRLSCVSRLW